VSDKNSYLRKLALNYGHKAFKQDDHSRRRLIDFEEQATPSAKVDPKLREVRDTFAQFRSRMESWCEDVKG
jgi:hypothetical protein